MPFTLAHPLLPFLIKKGLPRLSLTAAVAGSIMPDMANFFLMYESGAAGHSPTDVLLFDIPAGLLLCFLFHQLIRNPFINNLPRIYRKRYIGYTTFSWIAYAKKNKLTVFLSLLMGIVSHFAWDSFTHHDGLMVGLIPLLAVKISFAGTAYPVFHLLQLLSSIGGMWLLHGYIVRSPVTADAAHDFRTDRYYWRLFIFLTGVLLTVRLYGWPELNSYLGLWRAGMGAGVYAWILVSVVFYRASGWTNPQSTKPVRI